MAIVAATMLIVLTVAGCGGDEDPLTADAKRLFGYDTALPLETRVSDLAPVDGTNLMAVTYEGSDRERVPALFAAPAGAQDRPCVLYMHGYRGRKEDAEALVGPLGDLGFGLFAIDAPYHGERGDADRVERIIHDPQLLPALLSRTVVDLRRGLDFLESREECDPSRLGVAGLSFGGLTALLTSAVDDRVRSTVTLSIAGGFESLLSQPGVILQRGDAGGEAAIGSALETLAPYAPQRWVKRISPRSLLMINGRVDRLNPEEAVTPLHEAAGEGSEVFWHDGGHNPFVGASSQAVLDRVEQFERESLAESGDAG